MAIKKDTDACFNEIYDSTNRRILAFITAKCGRTSDISDIFQDTYMELYQALTKRGAGYVTNGSALVFRIARQQISRYYKLQKKQKDMVSLSENDGSDFAEEDAELFLTEDFTVNRMVLDEAKKFIRGKPEDVRKIFYMFYDLRLTIPEIAKALSIGESGVKNKLYRTVGELRRMLI